MRQAGQHTNTLLPSSCVAPAGGVAAVAAVLLRSPPQVRVSAQRVPVSVLPICEQHGLPLSKAATFGDNHNDIEMLKVGPTPPLAPKPSPQFGIEMLWTWARTPRAHQPRVAWGPPRSAVSTASSAPLGATP